MATIHKLTKDGATIFPATITDAVVHPQTGKTLTSMIKDYNVSELFPSEGIDGGNKYNLALAISVLNTHLSAAQKTGGIKLTFISSVSPYPEEEYYLGKSSWSTTAADWDQRFEVGDVIANPSGSWEPETAEQYIDSQIATVTGNLTSEIIARQTGDNNLRTQLQSEMSTRADQDANLNALINAGIREGGGVQFDTVPTQNSANGITSGGIYSTLRDSNMGFVDDEPTINSGNLVKSGGVAKISQEVNTLTMTFTAGTSGYTDYNEKLLAGRRYRVQNIELVTIEFRDENNNLKLYVAGNTDDIIIPREDWYGPYRMYNGQVIITPIDSIDSTVFASHIKHSDDADVDMFIEEMYIRKEIVDAYDEICLHKTINSQNKPLFRILGVNGGNYSSPTVLVNYRLIEDTQSHKVYDIGIGYAIYRTEFQYFTTSHSTLYNFDKDHNPIAGALKDKIGKNLISDIEWGKCINSVGGVGSTDSTIGITNKIYFDNNTYITCNNFQAGIGTRCATYTENGTVVNVIDPSDSIVIAEKTQDAAYAIFTVSSRLHISATPPMAQYGQGIDDYKPYSEIGGYFPEKVFYCGATRPYKKLKDAIEAAEQVMDATLYVDAGVYDLIQEYGAAFFEALSSENTFAGITLKNRIHVIFSPNAIVKLNYIGSNEYVQEYVSIFQVGRYGFTLENVRAEGSRIRYIVHDDVAGDKTYFTQHKYLNCNFKIDNHAGIWSNTCIGGGLGLQSEVLIQGCVFDAYNSSGAGIYYHQSSIANEDGASHLTIVDNYLKNGCINLSMGTLLNSDLNTIILVANNSVPTSPYIDERGVNISSGPTAKTEIYAYNNQIRS